MYNIYIRKRKRNNFCTLARHTRKLNSYNLNKIRVLQSACVMRNFIVTKITVHSEFNLAR